jgi:hypothetical protein
VILTTGMAHPRKLVRHAVVAMLTNATSAVTRVDSARIEPHKKNKLPAISVYTSHDQVDEDASAGNAPRERKHDLELQIQGVVDVSDTVADDMDDLAEQIEAVMEGDPYLQGTAGESMLKGTVMQVLEPEGRSDPTVGVVTLVYGVTYHKSPAAPGGLDDFKTVDAKHQLVGGVADTVPAEDTFTVQETTP